MEGTIVGSYRIIEKIAVGGMGTVYRGEHTLIGRVAAIKVLHTEMTQSRDIVQRFFNEAKATSTIKHPGIVEVFDFGHMDSGHAFLVMEFLEGQTLSQRLRSRGRLPEGEAAMLMRGVCSALAAAHAKGVVHRDLKPDNIFIVPEPESALGERAKILDFGIAKLTDIGLASSATKTGAVMGTPTYMSPEQCSGVGNVDHRADLYSIGCMLYELVVGRPPFISTGAGELLGCHLFVEPELPSKHGPVSPEMEALIMNLLAKQPAQRVQHASELGQLLVGVAQAQGWIAVTSTDPNARYSMHHSVPSAMPQRTPAQSTPMNLANMTAAQMDPANTTPQFTPGPMHVTPAHQSPTVVAPEPPSKPTTLSGSAGESRALQRSRRGVAIALGAVVVATAVGIAFVVGTSKADDITPASSSAPATVDMRLETKPTTVVRPPLEQPAPPLVVEVPEPPVADDEQPVVADEKPVVIRIEKKPGKKPGKKPAQATKKADKKPDRGDKDDDLLENEL